MENQTQKRIPGLWWLLLLEGITTIILGILLISQPAGTLAVIVIFLGIYWLIEGIFHSSGYLPIPGGHIGLGLSSVVFSAS